MKLIWHMLIVLILSTVVTISSADQETRDVLDEVRVRTLMHKVKSHPDAVKVGTSWWRIIKKENLSDTAFDWRFDMRMIDVKGPDIAFGHREEQNSGSTPNASWVIDYNLIDREGNAKLDYWDKDRFISIEIREGAWYRTGPRWPDKHRYGDKLTEEEAYILFDKELTYWENNLK